MVIEKRRLFTKPWIRLVLALFMTHSFALATNDANLQQPIQIAQANLSDQLKKQNLLAPDTITVLFPDIAEPNRSVFTQIIEGIETETKIKVRSIPISDKIDGTELYNQLKKAGTKVVIALGKGGIKISSNFDRDITVIVSGAFPVPDADNSKPLGISLTPDPTILFSSFKELVPTTKRVFVVYDPKNNEWLIKIARAAAKAQGIELIANEARDLASAAKLYDTIFTSADSKTDAVWLPNDSTTVDEATILPLVLKESWNRNIPIFSSSFIHAKKGALFSVLPDNVELGRTLANSAMNILAGDVSKKGVVPLRQVQTALNTRAAQHIGLNINARNFKFIFPEQ
jgi:putative tryptophan/tyrosine transport system substrate-binding protein